MRGESATEPYCQKHQHFGHHKLIYDLEEFVTLQGKKVTKMTQVVKRTLYSMKT